MAKNLREFLYPNEPYDENYTLKVSKEKIDLLKDACLPDYIRIIQYLEKKEKENKSRNNITFMCTILAAVFAAISAIPVIVNILVSIIKIPA